MPASAQTPWAGPRFGLDFIRRHVPPRLSRLRPADSGAARPPACAVMRPRRPGAAYSVYAGYAACAGPGCAGPGCAVLRVTRGPGQPCPATSTGPRHDAPSQSRTRRPGGHRASVNRTSARPSAVAKASDRAAAAGSAKKAPIHPSRLSHPSHVPYPSQEPCPGYPPYRVTPRIYVARLSARTALTVP